MMISPTPEVDTLIEIGAPLIICVSGGKDSRLVAEQTVSYARRRKNHNGRIILVYADLGNVVWADATDQCQRLAQRLNVELQIVGRKAGGLMERWTKRWENNVDRYINLSCVKLILPWSTPQLRFCTSELKTQVIQRWIRKTFNEPVICVLGIRRDESNSTKAGRGIAPVAKLYSRKPDGTKPPLPIGSVDWNAIIDVKTTKVVQIMQASDEPIPRSYLHGATRYSCAFCIMATKADLLAATSDHHNHDIYRQQCELEITSTFSFQSNLWLSDIAPHLLSPDQQARLPISKEKAKARTTIEATIPSHLLYEKGWPNFIPTLDEATLLAGVREQMANIMNIDLKYTTPSSIIERYEELIRQKAEKSHTKSSPLSLPPMATIQPPIPVLFPI